MNSVIESLLVRTLSAPVIVMPHLPTVVLPFVVILRTEVAVEPGDRPSVFSCLGVMPPPLPPNEFHERSCGFRGAFEQIRLVFGQFLAVTCYEGPRGDGGGRLFRLVFSACFGLAFAFWGAVRGFLRGQIALFSRVGRVTVSKCWCLGLFWARNVSP